MFGAFRLAGIWAGSLPRSAERSTEGAGGCWTSCFRRVAFSTRSSCTSVRSDRNSCVMVLNTSSLIAVVVCVVVAVVGFVLCIGVGWEAMLAQLTLVVARASGGWRCCREGPVEASGAVDRGGSSCCCLGCCLDRLRERGRLTCGLRLRERLFLGTASWLSVDESCLMIEVETCCSCCWSLAFSWRR